MARLRKSNGGTNRKKPIEQYDHKGKKRTNNPPVGLVTPETDQDRPAKKYAYDPHIDPALQFDSKRSKIEKVIDDGLAATTPPQPREGVKPEELNVSLHEALRRARIALTELKKWQQPYLNWAGKAERTAFEVPTVSLHVHERIDPRTIIEAVRKRNGNGQPAQGFFFSRRAQKIRPCAMLR